MNLIFFNINQNYKKNHLVLSNKKILNINYINSPNYELIYL